MYTSNPTIINDDDGDDDDDNDDRPIVNGARRTFRHGSGFGAIDAEALVTRARRWINVPPQMARGIVTNFVM